MSAGAQQNRHVVYFTDKDNTPFTTENPSEFLSARSLDRRTAQEIPVIERDLPVDPVYLEQVAAITGKVYYPSKWLNAVLVQCTNEELTAVQALAFVTSTEQVANGTRLPEGGRQAKKMESLRSVDALNDFQLELHGIPALHDAGYRGEGMMVAVMDGGFAGVDTIQALQHVFEDGRILISENIATQSPEHFNIQHGTNVFSIMAGLVPDQYTGIIPEATFLLFDTEDPFSEQRVEEYNWIVAAEKADSAGVDVINTSLGYSFYFDDAMWQYTYEDMDGNTAMITRGANWASSTGMLVVTSAGNEGGSAWTYVSAPADAAGVLAVGAINNMLERAVFSSIGPTFDGRTKPDVVSLGQGTVLIRSDNSIASSNGTSFSAPVICGFVTALWQKYPGMTASELRQYVLDIGNQSGSPDNELGFGIPSEPFVTATEDLFGEIVVFPNPIPRGEELILRHTEEIRSVRVLSLDGRLQDAVIRRQGNDLRIDFGALSGMFILQVETPSGRHSRKVISN